MLSLISIFLTHVSRVIWKMQHLLNISVNYKFCNFHIAKAYSIQCPLFQSSKILLFSQFKATEQNQFLFYLTICVSPPLFLVFCCCDQEMILQILFLYRLLLFCLIIFCQRGSSHLIMLWFRGHHTSSSVSSVLELSSPYCLFDIFSSQNPSLFSVLF